MVERGAVQHIDRAKPDNTPPLRSDGRVYVRIPQPEAPKPKSTFDERDG